MTKRTARCYPPGEKSGLAVIAVASAATFTGMNLRARWETYRLWSAECQREIQRHRETRQTCLRYAVGLDANRALALRALRAAEARQNERRCIELRRVIDQDESLAKRLRVRADDEVHLIEQYQHDATRSWWDDPPDWWWDALSWSPTPWNLRDFISRYL